MKPSPPTDLWERLNELERRPAPVQPEGTFTVRQFAEQRGINRRTAAERIVALMLANKVEPVGRLERAMLYRIKE